jgi:hypothetical protein
VNWRAGPARHARRSAPRSNHPRRILAVLAVLAVVLLPAAPVSADPARPTDFRSRVLSITPALPPGVDIRVVGGDAFLELTAHGPHTVIVPDYDTGNGKVGPYLRFEPGGRVERNARSAATAANRSRYGTSDRVPNPTAEPEWEQVATNGRYVWHDHRTHWMSSSAPPLVGSGPRVDLGGPHGTWSVDLVVDGRPTAVVGELLIYPSPSPWPWYAVIALLTVGAVGLALVARRRHRPVPYRAVALGAAVVSVAATAVGWAAWRDIPVAAGGNPIPFLVPLVGLTAAIVATVVRPRRRLAPLGAAAAALLGWAVLRHTVFDHAILLTYAPAVLDRATTAVALGAGAALALLLVWLPPRPEHRKRATTRRSDVARLRARPKT